MKAVFFTFFLLGISIAFAPANEAVAAKELDLQALIQNAIDAGQKKIVVPPGKYCVSPKNDAHLILKNLADITIIADGVEMICTQTRPALVFKNCRNIHVKGFTIDYDPLPFTEGRIVAMPPDKSWVEFEIIDGYPENQLVERIEFFDPTTRELRRETPFCWVKNFQSLGNHRYRVAKRPDYRYNAAWDTEQVGDILVTNNWFPDRGSDSAVTLTNCAEMTLEDITLYASSCLGFVEKNCDASTYLHCKIDRRPPETDLVKRGFPRMRSLNADAFHIANAKKGPAIIGCTAKFMGDDCVNIHGTYHIITACNGNQLRIATLHGIQIQPGDPVEFLPFDGERPANAVAVKIEPDGPMKESEKAFFEKAGLVPSHRETLLGGNAPFFKISLDRPVELPMGSAICSSRNVGNGFLVKDCDFGYNRSRGILIKASQGQVIDNTISHTWMAAVLVSPEYSWLEAACSSDVVVRGNKIIGCRRPAIDIAAPGGNGKPLPSGAHRNISITDNSFVHSVWPNITATSTDDLVIQDNLLTPESPSDFVPPIVLPWTWGEKKPSPVLVEFCNQPKVQATIGR